MSEHCFLIFRSLTINIFFSDKFLICLLLFTLQCTQDARANEVDSGTELEEDEIEEIGAVEEEKGEEEKKED